MIDSLQFLPVGQFEFRLAASQDMVLYPILGSMLRGAFGSALKSVSCTVSHRNCARCVLSTTCSYTCLFEPQINVNAPRPFTFQIPVPPLNRHFSAENSLRFMIRADGTLPFGLSVFGVKAIERLPYVIRGIEQMARTGFGMPRRKFFLRDVTAASSLIFTPEQPNIIRRLPERLSLGNTCKKRVAGIYPVDRLTIRFLTPVWLREKDRFVEEPTFFQLVKFLLKRLQNVLSHYSEQPAAIDENGLLDAAHEIRVIDRMLWRHDFDFYSNRRRRRERQHGILGEMTFAGGCLNKFLPLLAAGEVLHVGSKTSFGLGRYEIL